jgi:hypothetical protein
MDNPQFSPDQEERWVEISDFPGYEVSDWGRVMRTDTGAILTPTSKPGGLRMIGLMKERKQHKRSLALLVARAFVPPHPYPSCDTPIHLNGDRAHNHYTNLMWRPLWFARKYQQQFSDGHPTFEHMIEDVETHITYKDSWSAAVHHGLLDTEIITAMHNNLYVWPTGQIFREAIDC